MKQWVFRIALLAVLVYVGYLIWGILFPNPEREIRKRLGEVAKAASFPAKESPAAQALNANHLTTFCTEDIEVVVELPGRSRHTATGREELLSGAMAARNFAAGLEVEFLDINITLSPDKESAVADLTAKGKVPGEKDILVQELKIKLKKIGRQWYLQKVETVKSLSNTNTRRRLANSKSQAPSTRQPPNSKPQSGDIAANLPRRNSVLEPGAWNFTGAWRLEPGAFSFSPLS